MQGLAGRLDEAQDGGMSDEPPGDPEPAEKIVAAFASLAQAMTEAFRPVVKTLTKIAQDPRIQAAIAADREPGRPGCHCLCAMVHRNDPGVCEGESAATVRISGMDVPMCAPCQAARAASKLSH
jgi:hypothetical protein